MPMPPQLIRILPFLRWPRPSAALLRGEAMALSLIHISEPTRPY
mgnify:CR=1 FL=1